MLRSLVFVLFYCCQLLWGDVTYPILNRQALSQLSLELGRPVHESLLTFTQKHWLRPSSQERWEMQELPSPQRELVLNWAQEQKLFLPCFPSKSTYDQAVILGASIASMQLRLNYLKELWEQGIRFQTIVWLVGARPLDSRIENYDPSCHTETDAARKLWETACLPKAMHHLPVLFIHTPMQGKSANLRRPNTQDTVISWMAQTPPCSALFISNQPFCGYQGAVLATTLPKCYTCDVVGPGVHPCQCSATIILDTLARWLYQEDTH